MSNTPYIPKIHRLLPQDQLDKLIHNFGVHMKWAKGHACPCTFASDTPGSPDNGCKSCGGRGIYWDAPSPIFNALMTFIHTVISPDEPGTVTDPSFGITFKEEPLLSLSYADAPNVWKEASIYDAFIEWDAFTRYEANLEVGNREWLPYQQNASVDSVGDVVVYNSIEQKAELVPPTQYSFSDGKVVLTGYPVGTPYMVQFYAATVFIAYDQSGGLPHIRPFYSELDKNTTPSDQGNNVLPRRFRLQFLDLWLRARGRGFSPNRKII